MKYLIKNDVERENRCGSYDFIVYFLKGLHLPFQFDFNSHKFLLKNKIEEPTFR